MPLLSERGLPPSWAIAVPAGIGAMQVLGRLALQATAIARYASRERVGALSGLQPLPGAVAHAAGPILLAGLWSVTGDDRLGPWTPMALGPGAALLLRLAQRKALNQG